MLNELWKPKRFGYALPDDIVKLTDEAEIVHSIMKRIATKQTQDKESFPTDIKAFTQYKKLYNQFESGKAKIGN